MKTVIMALVIALAGCGATLQTYDRLAQESNREITTYVGGQVLKVQRTSDLPNAFGKADVFGGKVDRGFTELRFQGLAPDGRSIFRVTDIDTQSNETTMSRYGGSTSNLNAQRVGNSVIGTVTTYSAPRGSTEMLPPNTTQFAVDLNKSKDFTVAGIKVRILAATDTSLTYVLER
ncbi:MAG: peptidase [Chitinophagaceae bacterium]|nr:peptidase [Polaromonas sp.]